MFYAVITMRPIRTIRVLVLLACVFLLPACSSFSPTPQFEAVQEFNGTTPTVTELFRLRPGAAIVALEHQGERNFIVWLEDETADEVELLVNEIGQFSGSTSVHIETAGWYMLDVKYADGAWSIRVEQLQD